MPGFSFERDADLKGVTLITPFSASDARGDFTKYFEKRIYAEAGLTFNIHEVFTSVSERGVIRGMHFQSENPQAKLVTALTGAVYDVAIDLRKNSATFGQWKGFALTGKNKRVIYIPKGFAHGFLALEPFSTVMYKCDAPYSRETDGGILWNDPDIGVAWPLDREPVVSERDTGLMRFEEFKRRFGGFAPAENL